MDAITPHQALTIFAWFLLATLLVMLLLVARLYRRISGRPTYFWAFALPIVLFGAGSARYAFANQVGGDALGDSLWFAGGVLLTGLSIHLSRQMHRRK